MDFIYQLKKNKEISILFFLMLIFFWKIPFYHNQMIYPAHDIVSQYSYWRWLFADSLTQFGELPLWNRYVFSGTPFIGNPLSGMFYPINLLFTIFPVDLVFGYIFMFDILLIGLFTYLFARTIYLSKYASMISAIIFMFSGTIVSRIYAGHLSNIDAIVWFPLIILFYELAIRTRNFIYAILSGFPIGFMFLTGNIHFATYGLFGAMLYFVFRSLPEINKERNFKNILVLTSIIVISLIAGFSLAAVQLLPSLEFSSLSNRGGGVSYEFATYYSFPPYYFITFLIPELFGYPVDWELNGYVGVLALLLGLIGIIFKKNRYTLIFTGLVLFTLLFSLGKYTPLLNIFYYYVPGFNMFRIPATFLYIYVFSVSILAGFGCSFLIDRISEKDLVKFNKMLNILTIVSIFSILLLITIYFEQHQILLFGKSIVAQLYLLAPEPHSHPLSFFYNLFDELILNAFNNLIVFIFFLNISFVVMAVRAKRKINLKHVKILLILLILFDLWFFGMKYIETKKPTDVFNGSELIDIIKKDNNTYRVFDMSYSIGQEIASKNRIELINGYDPTYLRYYQEFLWLVGNNSKSRYWTSIDIYDITNPTILYLLNTKYIITSRGLNETWCREIYIKNGVFLCEIDNTMPRAYIVHNATIIYEKEDIFNALSKKNFNPKEQIILEIDAKVPLENPGRFEEVKIISYGPNKINIETNISDNGFLVLSEIWYPGWKAYDNGIEIDIYKTNYVLRSIYLNKGEHRISFVYNPESYKFGRIISLVSFVLIILILFILKILLKR